LVGTLDRVALGSGPTPVRRLDALGAGDVWVKDDGLYGEPWGGNKVRKLEWTLADAVRRHRRAILTVGGLATNHGLATAVHAGGLGLRVVLALADQPLDAHAREQLDRIERSGAAVYRTRGTLRTAAAVPALMLRHADLRQRRLPYFLPLGGSSPLGCLGYVEAALELGEQVAAGELPEPTHAVLAVGSGGTAAGLVLGLRLAGLRTRVVGVLVNDRTRMDAGVIARLSGRAARLLRRHGADPGALRLSAADLDLERDWLGPGYGHATPEGEEALALARDREGLMLEPVYTAKAMAGLLAMQEAGRLGSGPVLYWHTHNARAYRA
jgi:D-cysteine desulfhydrase